MAQATRARKRAADLGAVLPMTTLKFFLGLLADQLASSALRLVRPGSASQFLVLALRHAHQSPCSLLHLPPCHWHDCFERRPRAA
eukprot:3677937-Rhodomonas_salina.1